MKIKADDLGKSFTTGGIFLTVHAVMEHGISWDSMTSPLVCFGVAVVLAVASGVQAAKATK